MDLLKSPKTKEEYLRYTIAISESPDLQTAQKKMPENLFNQIHDLVTKQNMQYGQALEQVKRYLNALKVVKIYLPFEPTHILEERILKLFDTGDTTPVLEFVVDEGLIGGVKVAIDGKFYDYSLARHLI